MPIDYARNLLPANKAVIAKVAIVALALSTAARGVVLVAMLKPSVISTLQFQGRNVLLTCVVRNLGMLPLP